MAINEIAVAVGILSGAMIYGQTASEMEFPKEINEGVYNTLPVSVHEVNWSDNTNKLHKLYASGINTYNETAGIENGNSFIDDKAYNASDENDNTDVNNNLSGSNNSKNDGGNIGNYGDEKSYNDADKYNKLIMSNDEYLALIKKYEDAGYKHFVIRFPVGKFEPLPSSEFELYNLFPFDDIATADVYGFASPDGLKPKMQEDLSKNRMNKIVKTLNKENITVKYNSYHLCGKDVPRDSCWRADIFFKTKTNTIDK